MVNENPIMSAMPEGEYYELEVTGNSAEWSYIIAKLILKCSHVKPDEVLQPDVAFLKPEVADGGSHYVYFLSKRHFPPAAVAKALGAKEATVKTAKRLRLKPFAVPEGLPQPTVPYHGEA